MKHVKPKPGDSCKDPSGTLPFVWSLDEGMGLRKMRLGSDLDIRESSGASVAMHILKIWQEPLQRSIKLFPWVVSFQLLTGGRLVVQFSRI